MAITTTPVTTGNVTTFIASAETAITFVSICNHGATDTLVNVYIVPNGSTASTDNIHIKDLEVLAGDTYIMYKGGEKVILENNDSFVISSSQPTVTVITSSAVV